MKKERQSEGVVGEGTSQISVGLTRSSRVGGQKELTGQSVVAVT